jgi:L-threonylcarbamoyladenylate synthase
MILRRDTRVLDAVTGGQDTVGLRVPAHPVALELLHLFGDGIAAPSANRFGHVSPTTAAHVQAELGNEVDMILDGGACTVGIESTIVDLSATRPRILRPGGVSRAQLEAVLGEVLAQTTPELSDAPRVSGSLASHYAPRTPVRWVDRAQLGTALSSKNQHHKIGVIALHAAAADDRATHHPERLQWRTLPAEPSAYAQQLYAQLRDLDDCHLDLILLEVPPDTAPWEAVRDRLRRAAGLG